jgi:hypothetical protein
MAKSNINALREIADYVIVNYEKQIPKSILEELIRQKIGGNPRTIEMYYKLFGEHYRLFQVKNNVLYPDILPNGLTPELVMLLGDYRARALQEMRHMTQPASKGTLEAVGVATLEKKPDLFDKPRIGKEVDPVTGELKDL